MRKEERYPLSIHQEPQARLSAALRPELDKNGTRRQLLNAILDISEERYKQVCHETEENKRFNENLSWFRRLFFAKPEFNPNGHQYATTDEVREYVPFTAETVTALDDLLATGIIRKQWTPGINGLSELDGLRFGAGFREVAPKILSNPTNAATAVHEDLDTEESFDPELARGAMTFQGKNYQVSLCYLCHPEGTNYKIAPREQMLDYVKGLVDQENQVKITPEEVAAVHFFKRHAVTHDAGGSVHLDSKGEIHERSKDFHMVFADNLPLTGVMYVHNDEG